ncbi:11884_t:CDS:1, partial [Racocetra persica]
CSTQIGTSSRTFAYPQLGVYSFYNTSCYGIFPGPYFVEGVLQLPTLAFMIHSITSNFGAPWVGIHAGVSCFFVYKDL